MLPVVSCDQPLHVDGAAFLVGLVLLLALISSFSVQSLAAKGVIPAPGTPTGERSNSLSAEHSSHSAPAGVGTHPIKVE